ncbi:MAG: bifunctional phosphoribosylaminoimidazolecarboxamide formyltransferase/IMP cyclohydrolase [Chlamydiae bacterium]|nr:bifunctional phosphoribosylaminoimidazolecarboxamide formyltransferase/IMP cyclohydrolase [Chlamydiota bacterium]MBI3266131.1 bifunctional phosphoribosylaminoimidazolecarboxamide formyltransferase/IMP cyclohydrolase [Chlamydiota bacterium]
MTKIERAIISVSDKKGIAEFATALNELGVEIISTGGTAKILKDAGIRVKLISDFTGFPEILDGRVKTLHPKVHGALLGVRTNPSHVQQMQEHNILPIDLVVVNLYPFEETISKEGVRLEEAIENIDIGGPAMLRSSSKNYQSVAVVVNPGKYSLVLDELKQHHCTLSDGFRLRLAQEAFAHTAHYDSLIAHFLEGLTRPHAATSFPEELVLKFEKVDDLRYGENPHQKAALYREFRESGSGIVSAKQLSGKTLSFNNLLDLDAACRLVEEFLEPASVIIKHNNPCGVALGKTLDEAFAKSIETDPVSAFGGVLAFNCKVEGSLAVKITQGFVEAIVAPAFSEEALSEFKKKKNLMLLSLDSLGRRRTTSQIEYDFKKIGGGLLLQEIDGLLLEKENLKGVTHRQPTREEMEGLLFAWTVCKHVRSNAIVFAKGKETIGMGAGQMSRVDSVKIALMKSQKDPKGSVMASDAFFPFRDGIDVAAQAGIKAVIQPGGSIRDEEVIRACDEKGLAMVLTGMRHFRH